MKIENMKLFEIVADKGGILAAADFAGIPKSTVSRKIKELEGSLGVQLINRNNRLFQLTETGEIFYHKSKFILNEIADLKKEIIDDKNSVAGRVTMIGLSPLIAWFSPYIKIFCEQYPQIEFEIHSQEVVKRSAPKRRFDIAIQLGDPVISSLIGKKIATAGKNYYASKDYISQYGYPESPDELKQHRIVFREIKESDPIRWMFQNPKRFIDLSAVHKTVVDTTEVNFAFIHKGIGIGLLPDILAWSDVKSGHLIPLFNNKHRQQTPIYFLWHDREKIPQRLRLVIDYFSENLQMAINQYQVD